MKKLLVIFLLLFSFITLIAQKTPPRIITHLLSQKVPVSYVGGYIHDLIPTESIPNPLGLEKQTLIKTKDRLLVAIDGSGILYNYSEEGGKATFIRLDSTRFIGHNFNAISFNLNNNIYSYGGYGFWRSNGLLRKFDTSSRQWDVLKLNRELPLESTLADIWIDSNNLAIYLNVKKIHHDGLFHATDTNPVLINTCYKLDLRSQSWEDLGETSFRDANRYNYQSPWGAIEIISPDSLRLLDFTNNRVGHLKNESHFKISHYFKNSPSPEIRYFIDSTLYFGNTKADYIDSVAFSLADFNFTGQKIYTPRKEALASGFRFDNIYIALIIIALASILALIVFISKSRKKATARLSIYDLQSTSPDTITTNEQYPKRETWTPSKSNAVFTEIEKSLLQLALEKEMLDYYITIEELNKITGVSNKNDSIQKKTRSETIHAINQKYQLLTGSNAVLIDKKRSEFDKRSFEYFIRKDKVEWVKGVLKG